MTFLLLVNVKFLRVILEFLEPGELFVKCGNFVDQIWGIALIFTGITGHRLRFHDFGTGALRKPIFLRYRTISGVAVSVHAIRTGANTLWTA